MTSEPQWKEIALEYRKEIELLHRDIDNAIIEFEKKMPRSFEKGLSILEHALAVSQENLYLTKFMEYPILQKVDISIPKAEVKEINDCFEGLL